MFPPKLRREQSPNSSTISHFQQLEGQRQSLLLTFQLLEALSVLLRKEMVAEGRRKTLQIIGLITKLLAICGVIGTISIPVTGSAASVGHHGGHGHAADQHAHHDHAHHMSHSHPHAHGAIDVNSSLAGETHEGHATCNMSACCPVASDLPHILGRTVAAASIMRRPQLASRYGQAPPDTSDKPPRLV